MPNANPTLQMEQPLVGHVSNAEVPSMRDVVVTPSEFIQSQQASQNINVGDVVVISGIVYDSRSGITELDDDTVFQGIADYLPGKAIRFRHVDPNEDAYALMGQVAQRPIQRQYKIDQETGLPYMVVIAELQFEAITEEHSVYLQSIMNDGIGLSLGWIESATRMIAHELSATPFPKCVQCGTVPNSATLIKGAAAESDCLPCQQQQPQVATAEDDDDVPEGYHRMPDGKLMKDSEHDSETAEGYSDYPESAKNNAKRVLKWKEEHGNEVKGMTQVGWTRANQLASGEALSASTVKRMAAFNRHRKNAAIDPKYKSTPWKDNGYVAWLGWGGTSGINWAIRKSKSIDNKSSESGDDIMSEENETSFEELYVQVRDELGVQKEEVNRLTAELAESQEKAAHTLETKLAEVGEANDKALVEKEAVIKELKGKVAELEKTLYQAHTMPLRREIAENIMGLSGDALNKKIASLGNKTKEQLAEYKEDMLLASKKLASAVAESNTKEASEEVPFLGTSDEITPNFAEDGLDLRMDDREFATKFLGEKFMSRLVRR